MVNIFFPHFAEKTSIGKKKSLGSQIILGQNPIVAGRPPEKIYFRDHVPVPNHPLAFLHSTINRQKSVSGSNREVPLFIKGPKEFILSVKGRESKIGEQHLDGIGKTTKNWLVGAAQ